MRKFTSVDELVFTLPKEEQVIVKKLRAIILECLPKAEEKISFGAPFYSHHKMICFIWPPSLQWGVQRKAGKHAHKGVSLGFCQGHLMANEEGLLLQEGRKQVYTMYFTKPQEIKEEQIRSLLFEAELIDQRFSSSKKKVKI